MGDAISDVKPSAKKLRRKRTGPGIRHMAPFRWKEPCVVNIVPVSIALKDLRTELSDDFRWKVWVLEEWERQLNSNTLHLKTYDLAPLLKRATLLLYFLEECRVPPVGIPDPTGSKRAWEKDMGLFRNQQPVTVELIRRIERLLYSC